MKPSRTRVVFLGLEDDETELGEDGELGLEPVPVVAWEPDENDLDEFKALCRLGRKSDNQSGE